MIKSLPNNMVFHSLVKRSAPPLLPLLTEFHGLLESRITSTVLDLYVHWIPNVLTSSQGITFTTGISTAVSGHAS